MALLKVINHGGLGLCSGVTSIQVFFKALCGKHKWLPLTLSLRGTEPLLEVPLTPVSLCLHPTCCWFTLAGWATGRHHTCLCSLISKWNEGQLCGWTPRYRPEDLNVTVQYTPLVKSMFHNLSRCSLISCAQICQQS